MHWATSVASWLLGEEKCASCDAGTGESFTELEHGVFSLGVCGWACMADVVGQVSDVQVGTFPPFPGLSGFSEECDAVAGCPWLLPAHFLEGRIS